MATNTGPPPGAVVDPYDDPFRSATVTPERVDMGVDYSGHGPIYALGPGIITEADNAWLGAVGAPTPGTFIVEKITQGSLTGKYIYYAEDIASQVQVGEKVDANTVIGSFTAGGQLETGFASGRSGETMAAAVGQEATGGDPGAFPTAFGEAYNQVLIQTGAPAGIVNGTPVGKLPKNWPSTNAPNTGNQQAQTTSFSLNPLTWLKDFFTGGGTDFLQRFGLIVFGGALVLVGIWLLAGKQTIRLAVDTLAPEAGAASEASRAANS